MSYKDIRAAKAATAETISRCLCDGTPIRSVCSVAPLKAGSKILLIRDPGLRLACSLTLGKLFRLLRRLIEWFQPSVQIENRQSNDILQDKKGIIFGVATNAQLPGRRRSLSRSRWHVWLLLYQGDRLKENVEGLTSEAMPNSLVLPAMSRNRMRMTNFIRLAQNLGAWTSLFTALAFAPREALEGDFLKTNRELLIAWKLAAYSGRNLRAPRRR